MANAARAPKIIEMPLKQDGEYLEPLVPAGFPSESPVAIAARKLEALAHYHLAVEEFEDALEAFRRLLKIVPARPDLLVQTVACMERLERWQEGAELLQPEVDLHPEWIEAALALGICRLHLKQPLEALAAFYSVQARHPDNSVARDGVRAAQSLLTASLAPARTLDWEIQLHDLAAARQWDQLTEACEPLLAEDEPAAFFYHAYALEQSGHPQAACLHYEKCLELSPNHREARFNLACLLIAAQDLAAAARHLDYLTSIDNENSPAWWNLLLCAEACHQHEQALSAARNWLRLEGFNPELRFHLGYNCLATGRYDEAARHFEICCAENAHWPEARINLALSWAGLGLSNQARTILEAVLLSVPSCREAAEALLALEIEQGRLAAAAAFLDELSNRTSIPAPLDLRLASAFAAAGQHPAALDFLERALRVEPGFGAAWLALAALYDHLRQPDHSLACRQMALRIEPALAASHFE
ncbi:MAG: tetratricopeptide repeat protein [Acidobacteriota bacterium]